MAHVSIDVDSGCWLWRAAGKKGYGRFYLDGKTVNAHTAAYRLFVGLIPKELCVMHSCDVRRCVNPEHLSLGSLCDNALDMVKKKRNARGSGHGQAKLTEDVVREILDSPLSMRELSRRLGVSPTAVSSAKNGRTWRHVRRSVAGR